jgi:hypothetical protein
MPSFAQYSMSEVSRLFKQEFGMSLDNKDVKAICIDFDIRIFKGLANSWNVDDQGLARLRGIIKARKAKLDRLQPAISA